MSAWFGRRRPADDSRLEAELRESLRAYADRAPTSPDLPDRILDALDSAQPISRSRAGAARRAPGARGSRNPGRPRWQAIGLPVAAAAAVAAIVAGVVVVTQHGTSRSSHEAPVAVSPPRSLAAPASSLQTAPAGPAPSAGVSSTSAGAVASPAVGTSGLRDVRVRDLTFVRDGGFALATADCQGRSGTCPVLLRTVDGSTWQPVSGGGLAVPGTTAGCTSSCVTDVRFANLDVGYAYGSGALLMTTDGGANWAANSSGGALALETLSNNVIRVVQRGRQVSVETAPLNSTRWVTRSLPDPPSGTGTARLSRIDKIAVLEVGGALYRSTDNGDTWRRGPAACGGASPDGVTTAADSAVVVSCSSGATAVSMNAGKTFDAPTRPGVASAPTLLAAASADVQLISDGDDLYRTSDAGKSWDPVAAVSGPIGFVGFEDGSTGRILGAGGRTIWTTNDAGASWHPATP